MTSNKTWKRVAAASLALTLVAGYVPANVGGFLTGGAAIVANADAQIVNTNRIIETITGVETDITIDYYDDGSVYISGYGVLPSCTFYNDTSITKIVFAEDCAISKIQKKAFDCYYDARAALTDVEINTTVPLSMDYDAFYYEGGTVNFKIKAPKIKSLSPQGFIGSCGAKINVVFELEEPLMLEPNNFSHMHLGDGSTFTVPYGSAVVRKLKYKFNDSNLNQDYYFFSHEGMEEQFWQEHGTLVEGQDYVTYYGAEFTDPQLQEEYDMESQYGEESMFWRHHSELVEGTDYVYITEEPEPVLLTQENKSLIFGNRDYELIIDGEPAEEVISDVTLNTGDGVINSGDITTYTEGIETELPTDITLEGYTFGGWYDNSDCEGTPVTSISADATGPQEFWAKWTANTYTVTWVDENGNELEVDEEVPYGTVPTYDSDEPVKDADAQYTYTFIGWDKDISEVTGDVTYTAVFDSIVNEYKVTWIGAAGEELEVDENVPYGEMPVYDGEEPTKDATDEFTYTFAGWTDGVRIYGPEEVLPEVTGEVTYIAVFHIDVNEYTVIWEDDEGNYLYSDDVEYGVSPVFEGEEPTKDATDEFTYTFAGWTDGENTYAADEELPEVTGEVTYTAVFDSEVNEYTVTWEDDQGNVLSTDVVPYGNMPVYDGYDPTKDATAQYTYFFAGWDKEISEVTGDVTYTAVFDSIVNEYTVTWVGADGEQLEVDENVPYGTVPTYESDEPVKDATAEFTYTFIGWDKDISEVTGNVTYTAVFDGIVNEYPVTWVDEDGGILYSNDVDYGDVPVFEGEEPTKEATAQYTYVFAGWTDGEMLYGPGCAFPEVTGEVTYTAVFDSILNTYKVTWADENGDELELDEEVPYGTVPTYDSDEPTKEAEGNYVYVFAGWDQEISEVTGDVTYTAQYDEYEKVAAVEPTCNEPGNSEYYIGPDGYYKLEDGEFVEIEEGSWIIPATEHTYGRPVWRWNSNNTKATATFKCVDGDDTVVLDADISSVTTEPTCTKAGKIVYTAVVTFNNANYSYTKTVAIPAAGHSYTAPVWTWSDDNTAIAKFVCETCSNVDIFEAEVTSETTAPTFNTEGKTVYTAKVTVNGEEYTDTKEVKIDKLSAATVISYEPGNNCVKLTWTEVENAEKYAVCGYVNGKWQKLDEGYDTSYILNGLVSGKNYKVAVIAKMNGIWSTDVSNAIVVTPNKPKPAVPELSYQPGNGRVKLTWTEIEGAEKYAVCGLVSGKWQILDKGYATSYILNDLKSGVDYQVAVIGMFDGQWNMDFSNAITVTPNVVTAPVYPKESVQYSPEFHKIKIDWTKVDGATQYGIAVKLAGKWKVQAYTDADTTTFTTPKLKPGSSYEVVICAKVDGKWQTQDIASRAFTVTVK